MRGFLISARFQVPVSQQDIRQVRVWNPPSKFQFCLPAVFSLFTITHLKISMLAQKLQFCSHCEDDNKAVVCYQLHIASLCSDVDGTCAPAVNKS